MTDWYATEDTDKDHTSLRLALQKQRREIADLKNKIKTLEAELEKALEQIKDLIV